MTTGTKILNSILMLCAVFMLLKQCYAPLTAKTGMLEMFSQWNFNKPAEMKKSVTIELSFLLLNLVIIYIAISTFKKN